MKMNFHSLRKEEKEGIPQRECTALISTAQPVNRFGAGDVRHLFQWRVFVLMAEGFDEKLFTFHVETSEYSSEIFGLLGGVGWGLGGACIQLWVHASLLGGCSCAGCCCG